MNDRNNSPWIADILDVHLVDRNNEPLSFNVEDWKVPLRVLKGNVSRRKDQTSRHESLAQILVEDDPARSPLPIHHLMVNARDSHLALNHVRDQLHRQALDDLHSVLLPEEDGQRDGDEVRGGDRCPKNTVRCWFVIELPVARPITDEHLLHRLIRRLYFHGALLGLSAHPALRQLMMELRLAYYQTRGKTNLGEQQKGSSDKNLAVDVEWPWKIKLHLGAGKELELMSSLVAEMDRLDAVAAEDLLEYCMRRLQRLDLRLEDLWGDDAQPYTVLAKERVQQWFRFFKERVFTSSDGHAMPFKVDLRPVVLVHALDHLRLEEVALNTSRMLRNVLVSVPIQFVFVGGLAQELAWHADRLELQPQLAQVFKHWYHKPARPDAGEDSLETRVGPVVDDLGRILVADMRRRLRNSEDAEAQQEVTEKVKMVWAFVSDLKQLIVSRLSVWKDTGVLDLIMEQRRLGELLTFSSPIFTSLDKAGERGRGTAVELSGNLLIQKRPARFSTSHYLWQALIQKLEEALRKGAGADDRSGAVAEADSGAGAHTSGGAEADSGADVDASTDADSGACADADMLKPNDHEP